MATVSKWTRRWIPLGGGPNSNSAASSPGWPGWFLHLIYLVGFKTKIATLLSWANTFLAPPAAS